MFTSLVANICQCYFVWLFMFWGSFSTIWVWNWFSSVCGLFMVVLQVFLGDPTDILSKTQAFGQKNPSQKAKKHQKTTQALVPRFSAPLLTEWPNGSELPKRIDQKEIPRCPIRRRGRPVRSAGGPKGLSRLLFDRVLKAGGRF